MLTGAFHAIELKALSRSNDTHHQYKSTVHNVVQYCIRNASTYPFMHTVLLLLPELLQLRETMKSTEVQTLAAL